MAGLVVLLALLGACGFTIAGTGDPTGDAGEASADEAPIDVGFACPSGFTLRAPLSCHRPSTTSVAWRDAEVACESDGAHLVVVDDSAEDVALPANVWIGASELVIPGTFKWVTGVASAFTRWAPTEPGAVGGASCVEARPDGWHDDNCPELKAYVCEYDGRAADPAQF